MTCWAASTFTAAVNLLLIPFYNIRWNKNVYDPRCGVELNKRDPSYFTLSAPLWFAESAVLSAAELGPLAR